MVVSLDAGLADYDLTRLRPRLDMPRSSGDVIRAAVKLRVEGLRALVAERDPSRVGEVVALMRAFAEPSDAALLFEPPSAGVSRHVQGELARLMASYVGSPDEEEERRPAHLVRAQVFRQHGLGARFTQRTLGRYDWSFDSVAQHDAGRLTIVRALHLSGQSPRQVVSRASGERARITDVMELYPDTRYISVLSSHHEQALVDARRHLSELPGTDAVSVLHTREAEAQAQLSALLVQDGLGTMPLMTVNGGVPSA